MTRETRKHESKAADTPEELALWIWRNYVGVPVAGAYVQEYEHLIERIRRLARSEFTTGLHEANGRVESVAVIGKADESVVDAVKSSREIWNDACRGEK